MEVGFMPWLLVLFLMLLCGSVAQQCLTLDTSKKNRLKNSCVGVVDYEYFLPPGFTEESLRDLAMSQLSQTALKSQSVECQSAFNTMVCSNVYKKCYDGLNLADTGTYNTEIFLSDTGFPFPLPFYRPCKSVCDTLHSSCDISLFAYFGGLPNCNATLDFSGGAAATVAESNGVFNLSDPYQYDHSNDADTCVVPLDKEIASNAEEYQYKDGGACAGLVDAIYVPPGKGFNDKYALLQSPYEVQDLLEEKLSDAFDSLPLFMEENCRAALRRKICASAFKEFYYTTLEEVFADDGQADNIAAAKAFSSIGEEVFQMQLTFAHYPSRKYCYEYEKACDSFLNNIKGSDAYDSLKPRCDGTAMTLDDVEVETFPDGDRQFVIQRTFPTGPLNFYSRTNADLYYNKDESDDFETKCPDGYVVPEHPDHEDTPDTGIGCAPACKFIAWSDDEYDELNGAARAIPLISSILAVVLVLQLISYHPVKDVYLLLIFLGLSLFSSVYSVAFGFSGSYTERFCYDNAVPRLAGQSNSGACVAQAAIISYTFLGILLTTLFMSLDLVLKSSRYEKLTHTKWYVGTQLFLIFVPPVAAVVYGIEEEIFGFPRGNAFCFPLFKPQFQRNYDFYLLGIPALIISGLQLLLLLTLVWQSFHSKLNKDRSRIFVVADYDADVKNDIVLESGGENNEQFSCLSEAPDADAAIKPEANADEISKVNIKPQPSSLSEKMSSKYDVPHRVHAMFLCAMFLFWVLWGIRVIRQIKIRPESQDIVEDYTKCVFEEYDGSDSYKDKCGDSPDVDNSLAFVGSTIVVFTGNAILAFLVYSLFLLCMMVGKLRSFSREYSPSLQKDELGVTGQTTKDEHELVARNPPHESNAAQFSAGAGDVAGGYESIEGMEQKT